MGTAGQQVSGTGERGDQVRWDSGHGDVGTQVLRLRALGAEGSSSSHDQGPRGPWDPRPWRRVPLELPVRGCGCTERLEPGPLLGRGSQLDSVPQTPDTRTRGGLVNPGRVEGLGGLPQPQGGVGDATGHLELPARRRGSIFQPFIRLMTHVEAPAFLPSGGKGSSGGTGQSDTFLEGKEPSLGVGTAAAAHRDPAEHPAAAVSPSFPAWLWRVGAGASPEQGLLDPPLLAPSRPGAPPCHPAAPAHRSGSSALPGRGLCLTAARPRGRSCRQRERWGRSLHP